MATLEPEDLKRLAALLACTPAARERLGRRHALAPDEPPGTRTSRGALSGASVSPDTTASYPRRVAACSDATRWLGETVRQIDSSLLDEWEALTDPDALARATEAHAAGEPLTPPHLITANERAFCVMVRNAMFQKVQLAARDRFAEPEELEAAAAALSEPPARPAMTAAVRGAARRLLAEHETMGAGPRGERRS